MAPKQEKKIRKVIFPVAGMGTRFLPATKAIPKEMLAVADRPLIQHAVDEAREAGIEEFIFVTSRGKNSIEDHFDTDIALNKLLEDRKKSDAVDIVNAITSPRDKYFFTRQAEALGLGHAVWCAKELIGDEPFAVMLPDDLIYTQGKGCLAQMVDIYNEYGGNVVAMQEVSLKKTASYGILAPEFSIPEKNLIKIKDMVEKPQPELAPSNLSIIGRYILQPKIFTYLDAKRKGAGGEIQLTDAMISLLADYDFYGYAFSGKRYDCGSKLGFIKANISFALLHEDIREDLIAFMREKISQ